MRWCRWWMWWAAAVLLLAGGCAREPETDPVSEVMKQEVAGSAARVRVVGRSDWEVRARQEQYWVNVRLLNEGGAGRVAVRAAIKTLVPYVGIGANPTEPIYFDMPAGGTATHRFTGTIPEKMADRAVGCVVEVHPRAETGEEG